ncbi:hypothetical protein ACVINI_006844 [Rhizobium beringeri]
MADVDPSICNERTALSSIEEGWQRRLAAECSSERSKREKQDVVEVLGPSRQSEALLCQLDDLPYTDKGKFVEQLAGTPEGRRALAEGIQKSATLPQADPPKRSGW